MLTGLLPHASHCQCFTCVVIFNPHKNPCRQVYFTTSVLMEKSSHGELQTCWISIATQYQSRKTTQVTELGFKPRSLDSELTFLTTARTSHLSNRAKTITVGVSVSFFPECSHTGLNIWKSHRIYFSTCSQHKYHF